MFKRKPKPEPSTSELIARIDAAIADLIDSRMHLLDLADLLEGRVEGLRMRHATTAPVL
jgi:hypothetical protein